VNLGDAHTEDTSAMKMFEDDYDNDDPVGVSAQ